MKKYLAEAIGTFTLVFLGCGTAMRVGCDASFGGGYVLTAMAFGLVIIAMAYSIGNFSGCHINPAVSLGLLLSGRMEMKDFPFYVIAQCIGSFIASAFLVAIFALGGVEDLTGGVGSNGLAGVNGNFFAGILVEVILTFIFMIAILGVTDPKFKYRQVSGLVIGFTLMLVHILGIGLTGTSVNPARSLGPAIFAAIINHDASPILQLPVFIIGPMAGAALASIVYGILKD